MPVLTRRKFEEMNLLKIGIITLAVLLVAILVALNSGYLYRKVTSNTYTALFSEAGGLKSGDEVRIAGVVVGKVDHVALRKDVVEARFTVFRGSSLGETTGASIKTATALGTKFLSVLPGGSGTLADGAEIPVDRTSAPYDVQELLDTLTRKVEDVDVKKLKDSLNTVSDTFADTPPELKDAITGLGRLSETIASRDAALQDLLRNAAGVSDILAQRSGNITTLFSDGNLLLQELRDRRQAIQSLLVNVTGAVTQIEGLVHDNEAELGSTLAELEKVLDLLRANDKNLAAAVTGLDTYVGSLGEAISSGPWFYALIPNLAPTNFAQQTLPSLLDQATPVSPTLLPGGSPAPGGSPR